MEVTFQTHDSWTQESDQKKFERTIRSNRVNRTAATENMFISVNAIRHG